MNKLSRFPVITETNPHYLNRVHLTVNLLLPGQALGGPPPTNSRGFIFLDLLGFKIHIYIEFK